jgi:hypothetical protein
VRPDDPRPRLVITTEGGTLTQPLPDDLDQACALIRGLASVAPSNSYWRVPPREEAT